MPSLKCNLKSKILSSSAKAIKMCVKYCTNNLSFIRIHEAYNRATPENFLIYKHAIMLHKLYNSNTYTNEWVQLNYNQILTSRQINFISSKSNRTRVGLNALANRLYVLNNKIPLSWLNMSISTFKVHCKKKLLF